MNTTHTTHSKPRNFYLAFLAFLLAGIHAQASLSGSYTIDPSSAASATNYTSFNDVASDLINGTRSSGPANGPGVSGAVTFSVSDGLYNEQVEFDAISGASATHTIVFTSASGDSSKVILYDGTYHGWSSNFTLHINGASYLTFNKMTIQCTYPYGYGGVVQIDNLASYNTFSHCQIIGVTAYNNSNSNALIHTGNNYNQINYNLFHDNLLRRGSYGFYVVSNPSTPSSFSTGNRYINNIIDSVYSSGIYCIASDSTTLNNNTIYVKGDVAGYGIRYDNQYGFFGTIFSTGQCSGNKITMPDGGNGIYFNYITGSSTYSDTIANNAVSVDGAASYGIYAYFCDYINFYYNSVLVYGIAYSPVSQPTALAVFNYNPSNACDVYNNNLVNMRLGLAYTVYGWSNSSKSIKNMDYNNLYAPNSSALLNYYYVDYKDLAAWKLNPFGLGTADTSVNPYFVSQNDLRASSVYINNKGVPISGLNIDINKKTRNASTPDIGAYEFTPLVNNIGVTALDSPSAGFCAGTRDIYARLNNFGTGAISSADINWSINGVPQLTATWSGTLNSGASTLVKLGSNSFSSGTLYTINASSANPNGVTDSNTSNDAFTGTITPGLSGSYLISNSGGSPDYTSLRAAASDLNARGVCGAVTMNIASGYYNEHIDLYNIKGASNAKRVTFQSKNLDSTSVTIDTTYFFTGVPTSTISFTNTSYVTFKKLTIKAGSSTGFDFYKNVFFISGGSCYDSIANNLIYGVNSSANLNGNGIYSPGDNDSFTCITHNAFKYGCWGVSLNGASTSFGNGSEPGNVIAYNEFDSFSQGGINIQSGIKPYIYNNKVSDLRYHVYGGNFAGVYCQSTNGAEIFNNKIDLIGGGYGIALYYSSAGYYDSAHVFNNFISVQGNSNPLYSNGSFGIYNYQSNYVLYAFNSINVTSTATNSGLYLEFYSTPQVSVLNNNIVNTGGYYAVTYKGSTPVVSNYNNFYVPSSNYLGSYLGTDEKALSDWQSATSLDANTISITPLFKSATDLHAQNTNLAAGTPLAIKTDIDGDIRAAVPVIGADEFAAVADDAGIVAIDSPATPFCPGTKDIYVQVANYGTTNITNVDINYSINGGTYTTLPVTFSPVLAVKQVAIVKISSLSFSAGSKTTIAVSTSQPNGNPDGNSLNDSANGTLIPAMNGTYTIDPGGKGDFTSFHEAADALVAGGVCGKVTINAVDGSYNDYVNLGVVYGTSEKNTVTFQSQSLDSSKVIVDNTSSGTSSSTLSATISLAGSKWITFQKLSIMHSSGGNFSPVVLIKNGASRNTFTNCVFSGVSGATSYGYSSDFYFTPDANNYNLITNNIIKNANEGVFIDLNSNYSWNNTVSYNWIDSCYSYGIKSWFTDSFTAIGNLITNLGSANAIGIDLYFDNYGFEILKNKIDLPNGGTGIHANFCNVNGRYAAALNITNNFVSVGGSSVSTGIFSQYDNGLTLYHNSVNMYNTNTNSNAATLLSTGGIRISSDVQNNIFSDSLGTAIVTDGAGYPSGDYNDLFTYSGYVGNYNGTTCSSLSDWQSNSGMDGSSITCNPLYASDVDLHVKGACLKSAGTYVGVDEDIDGQKRSTKAPDIGADEFNLAGDLGVSSILSPINASCGSNATIVAVKVHNYSKVSVSAYQVSVSISGSSSAFATQSSSKAIAAGADDTLYISFSPALNTTAGSKNFNIKAYTILAGDPDHSNDTSKATIALLQIPKASFVSNTGICSGTAIRISDKSSVDSSATVNYLYYLLDNAGNKLDSSTLANPVFSKTIVAGNYKIMQHIQYKTAGCNDTSSGWVQVVASPMVKFGFTRACINDTTFFTDSSTAGSGSISTYLWKFGNGDSATVQNPSEKYAGTGTYTVQLSVSNSNGCQSTASRTFTIDTVNAKFAVSVARDGTASFKALDSTLNAYAWNFGDASALGTGHAPSHVYNQGTYLVTLETRNLQGCIGTWSDSVTYMKVGINEPNSKLSLKVYPNPFQDQCSINYELQSNEKVTIQVSDMTGRLMATLVDKHLNAGSYVLNLNTNNIEAMNVSGIYFLKVTIGQQNSIYKLVKSK